MNVVQSAISSIRKKADEILNDNQGWFRGGQFTPVQQVQDINRSVQQQNNLLPVRSFGGVTIPNWNNPIGQDTYKSFGKGFTNSSTFGLVQPQYEPQTTSGKVANVVGNVAGFINPLNPLNKAMGALNVGGKVVSAVAPRLATRTAGKILGGVGSELAQTAAYTAAQAGSQALGLKSQEEITPSTFGKNLLLGTAFRGVLSPQVAKTIGSKFRMDNPTAKELEDAADMIANPKRFVDMAEISKYPEKQRSKLIQNAIADIKKRAEQTVDLISEKHLPTDFKRTGMTYQDKIKALVDLNAQNKLGNISYLSDQSTKEVGGEGVKDRYSEIYDRLKNNKVVSAKDKNYVAGISRDRKFEADSLLRQLQEDVKSVSDSESAKNLIDKINQYNQLLDSTPPLNHRLRPTVPEWLMKKAEINLSVSNNKPSWYSENSPRRAIYGNNKPPESLDNLSESELKKLYNDFMLALQKDKRSSDLYLITSNNRVSKSLEGRKTNEADTLRKEAFNELNAIKDRFYVADEKLPEFADDLRTRMEPIIDKKTILSQPTSKGVGGEGKIVKDLANTARSYGVNEVMGEDDKVLAKWTTDQILSGGKNVSDHLKVVSEAGKPVSVSKSLSSPVGGEGKINPILSTQEKISRGKIPTKVKTLLETKLPEIKQPAKINLQSGQVIKPNKLDSASEKIIQEARGQIGKPAEIKKTLSQKFDQFYTNWVDRYNPLVKLTEGVKNIDPSKDPKYVIRKFLGAGSIAEQRFNTEMKPILKQIDDLKIDKLDLDTYLINKRNVGFGEIGRKVKGSDPIKSQKVVNALEAKYGSDISTITDKLYAFQNQGLDDMVKAGFISPEAANAMRGQNPNYAPFQRVMGEVSDYLGLPTKKAMQGTQPIKKLKGSEKQILSPVESIIANIFSQRAAIEKNNVAKSVAGLQDIIPNLGFKKVSKGGDSTITVWNNGKKEFIEVGADIARAMKGMNEESASSFMKILTAPASLLRQGATGRNPEFMIPNVVRDQLDAATNSKYGYVPFVDYIRGLYHVARKDITGADEVFDAWMNSGGAQSFSSISGRKSISEMFDKTKAKKGLFSWLGSALDVAGKYSETPTRVGLFGKALKKGATALEAGYESREGTMDFARMGAKMKVANSIIPFLNVQVQGFDKMVRNFKSAPAKTTLKMGIYGVTPAVMATLYNEMYHPTEYAEIPQFVKDDNFILVKGRNDKGTVDYVAIPKGNLIRLATNPAEHFVSYLAGNDKTTFGEMVTQLLSSNLPLLGEGSSPQEVAIKTIGQNIPQAIKPITENLLNKSFYKYNTKTEQSKEIVPYYLQNKALGDQTYKFTPAMYQVMGKVLNQSPLKIQNLMEGYFAGYTKVPANIIDSLKNISEGKEVEQNKIPILRRFIQETYPTSTTVAKPKAEASPLIPQAQAAEGGFLDKIFPNRNKSEDLSTATEFTYVNENGNESKLVLSKLDDINNLPTSNKYQQAIRESKQYSEAAKILDNTALTQEQQQTALARLGIEPDKASYYQVANDNDNLKTMFVLDAVNRVKSSGGGFADVIQLLAQQRTEVNGKQIASDGVLDNLVDEGVITKAQATELKKYKFENGQLTLKKPSSTKTKAKKISVTLRKVSARTSISRPKVYKFKKPKLTYKRLKAIKLKTPLVAKR